MHIGYPGTKFSICCRATVPSTGTRKNKQKKNCFWVKISGSYPHNHISAVQKCKEVLVRHVLREMGGCA